jgi:D-alanyl-D-alanine carboxypeptidase/D-alanyl-D-alanine-endopeptidase (penicillin-binding protein 4)
VVPCLVAIAAAACGPRSAAPAPLPTALTPLQQLQEDIAASTRLPGVQHGAWGIVVHSLDRDERLFELHPGTLLVPASTAKLVSVASAVDAVGWDYRFQTTLSMSGPIADLGDGAGVLRGDLVVTGTGDPSIGGRGGDDLSSWVDAIAAHGIGSVEGRVIGDDDLIEEPRPQLAWAWDDLGYRTGAIFGALNYAENSLWVAVAAGAATGAPARLQVEPEATARPLVSRVETGPPGSAQLLWPEQRPGEPFLTIAGTIPLGAPPARLQVSAGNPTLWFASALRARLIAAGIPVAGDAVDVDDLDTPLDREAFTRVHLHESPPLSDLVQPLLGESINVYGEALLRLNAAPGELPTNDAALEGLRQRLDAWGVPRWGQQIVDGSGLSRRNAIAPETLVLVLARMLDRTGTSPWMTALPVAGVDGSLASRMNGTAAQGRVRAKTGTMSNVRALAGYALTLDGEHLAFAILVNHFEGTGAEANGAIDAIAVKLAGFSRGR